MYFCRSGVNDIFWTKQRMRAIPEELRQEVTDHYEKLIKPNQGYPGRDAANKYLLDFSNKYKPETKECEIKLKKSPAKKVKTGGKREYLSDDKLWSKQL